MPLAGGADESGEVQRRLMFFRAAAEMRPDAVTRFFLESWPRKSPPRRPVIGGAAAAQLSSGRKGCRAIREPHGTPSVVMQALGARTAIVAPAAKLNARPTTRKVRAIPEREPPKPVSPDPSLIVPDAR